MPGLSHVVASAAMPEVSNAPASHPDAWLTAWRNAIPGLDRPEADALSLAARSRLRAREEAFGYQDLAMEGAQAATTAQRAAGRAREVLARVEAARRQPAEAEGELARVFFGASANSGSASALPGTE
mmetsp:Transcript_62108/g.173464  ORF Transcript_62108/g.173464 Transcript_62108/m.173464 type:complete len:127 (-) Transcript_62108:151-531(-)